MTDASDGWSDIAGPDATPELATITRDELKSKLDRGDAFALLEVLPLGYWRKHHLPTARNLPPDKVREMAPQLVPDPSTEIVLYCWDPG
jgi:rhodanese-related sulfurtransferase